MHMRPKHWHTWTRSIQENSSANIYFLHKLIGYLDGLLAGLVLDEGDAVVEIEVKVLEGTVLDAQRLQGAAVYLRRQIPEEEPPLALEPVLPGGPPVRGARGRGRRPAGPGVAREAGRRPSGAGFAPQVLTNLARKETF